MAEPITRYRGDTMADEIIVTDAAGMPLDVTGYSFKMTVDRRKAPPDGTTVLFQIAGVLTNPTAGLVEFPPTVPQANQAPGTYYYDIQMTDTSGRIQTIALEKYIFTQDISK